MLKDILNLIPNIQDKNALELFGGQGAAWTGMLYQNVNKLRVWEKKSDLANKLAITCPDAEVETLDSFERIKYDSSTYDIVSADQFLTTSKHIDVFDLFPYIYAWMDDTYFFTNIWNDVEAFLDGLGVKNSQRVIIRNARYEFFNLEDPTMGDCARKYRELAKDYGFKVTMEGIIKRTDMVSMLVHHYEN